MYIIGKESEISLEKSLRSSDKDKMTCNVRLHTTMDHEQGAIFDEEFCFLLITYSIPLSTDPSLADI
jgi:hypothetical protein